jgi:DNA-binding MarR family transcriptional regulator
LKKINLQSMEELKNEILRIPLNLYRAAIGIRSELTRRLSKEFGEEFTADYWFILTELFNESPMTQTRLSEVISRDRASLSRTISCMERLGLVSKVAEPFDKRKGLLSPTKRAYAFKPVAEKIVVDVVSEFLSSLKPIEILEMNRMLGLIQEAIVK